MPDFTAKSPGDYSPARSAAWVNAVSAAAAAYHGTAALGSSKGAKPERSIDRAAAKVKNLTGSDLVRGNYVQLGEFELDARDPRKMWFEGNLYDEALPNRIAVVTNAVKEDARVEAVLIGMAVAVVNVSDTDHRFAEPIDGEFVLASAATGTIEILDTITTTGEQECAVLLSASGGSGASIAGSVGMVFGDIPLAGSWASMGGTPSLSWTVALGEAGPPALDDDSEWTETTGVLLFDWERLASTKETYIAADGTLAPYDDAFETMTPVVELAAGARRWAWRRGVNRSKTDLRASDDEPILVAGYEQTIRQDGGLYRLFVITDVMDFRAIPGFEVGTTPAGADDTDLQIPYHSGGNTDFEMSSEDCAGA